MYVSTLVADEIAAALPAGTRLFDSSEANVAAQTLRRIDALGRPWAGTGAVRVLLSGRPGSCHRGLRRSTQVELVS